MGIGLGRKIRRSLGIQKRFRPEYVADDFGVRKKNLGFMDDAAFRRGWTAAVEGNRPAWGGTPPDVRWRAHTALWAARHGLTLPGDFVECGVFLGFLSLTICHALGFASVSKKFYLFDTFGGLPDDGTEERAKQNQIYFDCFGEAQKNFAPFPNAHLVRGLLPSTLAQAPLDRIAYLSVDLNYASAEKSVIEELWDRLSPSAIVLIDDYAFSGHDEQYAMWNDFAASKRTSVLTMPTGAGVLIKA